MERGSQTSFEVFCHRCETSFALGTRRCVHCGQRLSRQRLPEPQLELAPLLEEELPDEVVHDEVVKRRGLFSPVTLMWVVLAVLGAAYRACSGAASAMD